jgi:hypothetical protein
VRAPSRDRRAGKDSPNLAQPSPFQRPERLARKPRPRSLEGYELGSGPARGVARASHWRPGRRAGGALRENVQILGNETFYNDACSDAWEFFWANQTIFTEEGEITTSALENEEVRIIVPGARLRDADAIAQLAAQDSDITHWAKGSTTMFEGDHWFEIHFYWHLPTNTVRFDLDFKLRFDEVFTP